MTMINEYKKAIGSFATGVAVASTDKTAMTINSLSSVSLEPILLLFSIKKTASRFLDFYNADFVAINILSKNQAAIARKFTRQPEKNDLEEYFLNENGLYILKESMAKLVCKKHQIIDGGDHNIFICNILSAETNYNNHEPLIYFRGNFVDEVK